MLPSVSAGSGYPNTWLGNFPYIDYNNYYGMTVNTTLPIGNAYNSLPDPLRALAVQTLGNPFMPPHVQNFMLQGYANQSATSVYGGGNAGNAGVVGDGYSAIDLVNNPGLLDSHFERMFARAELDAKLPNMVSGTQQGIANLDKVIATKDSEGKEVLTEAEKEELEAKKEELEELKKKAESLKAQYEAVKNNPNANLKELAEEAKELDKQIKEKNKEIEETIKTIQDRINETAKENAKQKAEDDATAAEGAEGASGSGSCGSKKKTNSSSDDEKPATRKMSDDDQAEVDSILDNIYEAVDGLGTKVFVDGTFKTERGEEVSNLANYIDKNNVIEIFDGWNSSYKKRFNDDGGLIETLMDDLEGAQKERVAKVIIDAIEQRAIADGIKDKVRHLIHEARIACHGSGHWYTLGIRVRDDDSICNAINALVDKVKSLEKGIRNDVKVEEDKAKKEEEDKKLQLVDDAKTEFIQDWKDIFGTDIKDLPSSIKVEVKNGKAVYKCRYKGETFEAKSLKELQTKLKRAGVDITDLK